MKRPETSSYFVRLLGAALLIAVVLCPACERDRVASPGEAAPLKLYCGAGLRPAVAEAVETFRAETGIIVECDYAGSGMLISRLRLQQTGDLFMPGDVWYVDQLAEHGMVDTQTMVTYFEPVILVAKGNPQGITGLDDLTRPGIRLGLGNPDACQIGRISQRILAKNDIDGDAVAKNLVFSSVTVNELGLQLKTGRIDAGIVWDAIAAYYTDVADVVRIPVDKNEISNVAIGVLSFSQNKPAANRFVEFLVSPQGKAIFAKHNYRTQPPSDVEAR